MNEPPSDFRSDTVTRPTEGMRAAMAAAEVGDDVLDGDPTVRALERRVAQWLGKQDALFTPSGTLANQCALGAWTRPGDEIVCERTAHLLQWEAGGLGANHGVQAVTFSAPRGMPSLAELEECRRPSSIHAPRTALLAFEQTFMGTGLTVGGHVLEVSALEEVYGWAQAVAIPVHLDGARLANAQVASGVPAAEYAACADSVAVCFSKGLGAPVGSALAGSAEFCARARGVRKRLGGWMRQAGILAAACLYALDHHLGDLDGDHRRARRVAAILARHPGLEVRPEEVETNICTVRVDPARSGGIDAAELVSGLAREGVLALSLGPGSVRFVTHRDLEDRDLERLAAGLERVLGPVG